MRSVLRLFQKFKEYRLRGTFSSNEVAVAIIRRFIQGSNDPYEWDDFESVEEKNPEVSLARELCWFYANRFPSLNSTGYCGHKAMPYFVKIADALEANCFKNVNQNEIVESLRRNILPDSIRQILEIDEQGNLCNEAEH